MKTTKDYPFPLPIAANKKDFFAALKKVCAALQDRNGTITDYYEQKLTGGGKAGVIEVEEDV